MPQSSWLQHEFLETNELKAEEIVRAILQTYVCEDYHKKYPSVHGCTVSDAHFGKCFIVKSDEYCCKSVVTTRNSSKPQPLFSVTGETTNLLQTL